MLLEHLSCPDAKAGSPRGIDGVAHRNDHVQVVQIYEAGNPSLTLFSNCFHFGNSCLGNQFTCRKDVLDMLGTRLFFA